MNLIDELNALILNDNDPAPFSGVVSLRRGDVVLFEQGYGYAQRAEEIPNHANTRFQMASGSKIFTAVAACKLIEQGKLSLDTKLFDHLGKDILPGFSREVTVKHLLTHSSGITSYFEEDILPEYEDLWQDTPMYRVRRPADFLQKFTNQTQRFKPGKRFEYNDGGFILLGLLCEIVSGKVFVDLVQEMVFNPANMTDSGYFSADQLPKNTAYAYIDNEDGAWRTNFFTVPVVGAPDGGAYTTAPDMAKFWQALFDHQLLSPEMTAEMLKPQITPGWDDNTHYGLGVWLNQENGNPILTLVQGSDPGVEMYSEYIHDKGVTLTMLGNTSLSLQRLMEKVEEVL